ncbi:MAG: hypothetical protein ACTHJ4_03175 [Candidatus Nucleicultricaceae bacterium]
MALWHRSAYGFQDACIRIQNLKKEHLTGEAYCVAKYNLLPIKNSNEAKLSLKYAKEAVTRKSPIKAKLHIEQKGREYKINPHEVCTLMIDGAAHPINIITSFQDPIEVMEERSVALPSGGSVHFNIRKEATIRKASFFLSRELFTKMIAAKKIEFNISPSPKENSPALEQYPIILELRAENIIDLQEFKSQCVDNFLITEE